MNNIIPVWGQSTERKDLKSQAHQTIQRTFFGCVIGHTSEEQFEQVMQQTDKIYVIKQNNTGINLKTRYYVYGFLFAGYQTEFIVFTFFRGELVNMSIHYYNLHDEATELRRKELSLMYDKKYRTLKQDLQLLFKNNKEEGEGITAIYYDGMTAVYLENHQGKIVVRYTHQRKFNKMREYTESQI